MTQRKPPGVSFESWIERQIREATDRGEFENLPGAGKPIPGRGEPYDELWWVKQKMQREQLSFLPPTLVLRKQAEDALDAAFRARSEQQVRRIVADINEKIAEAIRRPPSGPPLNLVPYDVERVVRQWRKRRGDR
jgi:predicted metal-dependent hydrolase